jgi:hypothetical protein
MREDKTEFEYKHADNSAKNGKIIPDGIELGSDNTGHFVPACKKAIDEVGEKTYRQQPAEQLILSGKNEEQQHRSYYDPVKGDPVDNIITRFQHNSSL